MHVRTIPSQQCLVSLSQSKLPRRPFNSKRAEPLSLSLSLSFSGPLIPAQTNHFPARVTTFPVDMELLNPTPPPQLAGNHSTGFSPSRNGFLRASRNVSYTSEISEEISEPLAGKVFVAVGKSVDKAIGLLEWTFRQFQKHQITLLHVHQPSATIPTLLGKLPVSQANEESICAYRREEKEQMNKLLCGYLSICCKAKVQASTVWIESGQVQKGIVELVAKHGIGKLVMGASPDHCMKVKMSSGKVKYTSKNAPPFCEIWFVCKGRHVWTREASGDPKSLPPFMGPPENLVAEMLKSESFRGRQSVPRIDLGDPIPREFDVSAMESVSESVNEHIDLPPSSSEGAILSHLKSKEEQDELESLYNQVIESQEEADKSKREAFDELLKCKKSESEALEAIKRAKVCEAAHAREVKLRKEVENALRTIQLEQQKLAEHRDEAMQELQKTMKTLAILDGQAGENARRRQEAAGQLKLIQASMATVRHEKQKIRRQRDEALWRLQRWRSCPEEAKVLDSGEYHSCSLEFADYSLLDLQTATCNFSESFMIGRGGYGCVYKGEIFHKTVAIKKLHPENMQGRSEFQQEVRVLSKLRHPNLVKLIGVCSEAWSLVYEYLPNGSLEDWLFCKNNSPPLTWKTRIKIASDIASALLFLHSSRPEKIVHGDLKPENILLDSNFNCKIGDFGICRLLPEENTNRPVFRRNTEPKGAFLYTDPEFQVAGNLTPKSDVYAFGIIILQLLTGRPPVGLAREVRHAVAGGRLLAVLDASAGEWPIFPARRLVELGLSFCEMNRRDRPELTAGLVRELKRLSGAEEPVAPSFFLCPILQEIMHDPQVAADGFTYEGEAMLGWLQNGRETSPMTNLKLSHLTLTPNRALRFAIQDWLSKF